MSTSSKLAATLVACALAFSSAGVAFADEAPGNQVRVEQRGQGFHSARAVQLGRSNTAIVAQDGREHTASIIQNGDDNLAAMRQIGRRQTGSIVQNGDSNAACLIQFGRPGTTSIVQNGGESVGVLQGVNGSREVPVELCTRFVTGDISFGRVRRR